MPGVPGIVDPPEGSHQRRASISELVHIRLAENYSARSFQSAYYFRIMLRYPVFKESTASGCLDPSCIEEVLESNGDAVQGAAPAVVLNLGFSLLGSLHRKIGSHGDIRV